MSPSQYSSGRLIPAKSAPARPGKRLALGTAIVATLSYLTLVLACACTDGKYLHPTGWQNLALETIASEAPVHDAEAELCAFMREHKLSLQAGSPQSMLVAKISYLAHAIDRDVLQQTPIVIAFRPPGNHFSTNSCAFESDSVLRI
jgi:hypothetical protein